MPVIPMADTAQALKKANQLLADASKILADPNATAEDRAKVPGMIEESKSIKTDLATLQSQLAVIDATRKELEAISVGASGYTPNGDGAGQPVDQKAKQERGNPEERDLLLKPAGSDFLTIQGYLKALMQTSARVMPKMSKYLRWFEETDPTERKDMNEAVGASGGFLVPPEFLTTLMALLEMQAIIRPRATVIRMRRRQVQIPALDQTSTTAGVAHWFGGIRPYWAEEASLKTASDAVFRAITLTAHKLICFTRVSDELLDDAVISLTDFLMGNMGFPGAIAFAEDDSFLNGDGVGKPIGIIGSPATINVARVDQDNVTYNDLTAMLEAFLPSGNGLWLASINNLSALLQMTGPSANPSYVWGPGPVGQTAVGRVHGTLLGYPIIFDEKLPRRTTTSNGDLLLVDPSYYLVGDRQATTLASTIYDKFDYDQTSFRAVHRVDGQPWPSAPFTLKDGVTQISPFVRLGAKSTS